MKNYRTKRLLVCVALSLVVHTGLAATFVYAVRPSPITFDLVNPIQVSLIEDYADAMGTSNSNAVSSEEFSEPVQKFSRDDNLNSVNTPAKDNTNNLNAAVAESQNTEVEHLKQRLDTSDLIESESEPELAKNKQVATVLEPKIEIVDEKDKSIPSSTESSFTAIRVNEKINQIDIEKSDAYSNQSRSERSLQAIEKHAYRNHPDSGTVLRNVPIVKPLADTDTYLSFSDFDSEFEPWTDSDHDSGSILQATLELTFETAPVEDVPQFEEDADELAGIAIQPESDHHRSPVVEILKNEVSRTEHTSVKSIEQLASMVDYDSQFSLLPQPELDEIQTHKPKEKLQPNVATESVSTPDEFVLVKFNAQAPDQPESDHHRSSAAEILETEVSYTEDTSVKFIKQLANVVDYDNQFQLLPQPEIDEVQTHQSEEQSRPNVATEIVNTPDESLIASFNGSAPDQPESDHHRSPAVEILETEVSHAEDTSVKSIERLASVVDYDGQFQLLPQPEIDEIQTNKPEAKFQPNVATETVSTPDQSALAKINVSTPNQPAKSVQQATLSAPRPSEHQKPESVAVVTNAFPRKSEPDLRNQFDQQKSVPSDFSSMQKLATESSPNDDFAQFASLNNASFDTAPEYGTKGLSNPAPRYPYRSRVNGEQGKVILEVLVNRKGRAAEITIAKSSGYSRLDKAARKAVKRWKFQPALKSGRKVQGVVRVPISFVLKNT